jgi:thioredoxin reductase (NADPH)
MSVNPELRVCLLDFVKPSPAGSKWGLGGTCVNVGCIPKKLMHTAAMYGDHARDAALYGWEGGVTTSHSWETLRNNTQDHIKGLNFGYRVEVSPSLSLWTSPCPQLREKGVSYLNKLAKLVDAHRVEVSDKKGSKTISGARIVIAVGGRPSPLQCEGAELAISSDDLFMKADPPGKTCVVGAGYVALECAGFIQGLRQAQVTVLVRSILLRGFDRCVARSLSKGDTAHGPPRLPPQRPCHRGPRCSRPPRRVHPRGRHACEHLSPTQWSDSCPGFPI